MANQVRIATQVTGAKKAASDLDGLRDRFDRLQKQGAKGFAIGAGAAVTTAALNVMGGAVSAVTNFLGDSIHAYAEEEQSVSQLGAALKANIPAWDGNTAAIEATMKAQMALGFSDEEQRASLALLVAATHDVTKAMEIQRTAMDLARFKGISLADATGALTKVEAGSYRILKSLGIVLKDGATQQDALNAVQRVAMGQADAYAKTISGKLLVAQIKFNEAQEKFGKGIAPIAADAMGFLGDAATTVGDAYERASAKVEGGQSAIDVAIRSGTMGIGSAIGAIGDLGKAWDDLGKQQAVAAAKAHQTQVDFLTKTEAGFQDATPKMKTTMTAFYAPVWKEFDVAAFRAKKSGSQLIIDMIGGIEDQHDAVKTAMQNFWDSITDPHNVNAERARLTGHLAKLNMVEGARKLTPEQKAKLDDARQQILNELGRLWDYQHRGALAKSAFVYGATGGASGSSAHTLGGVAPRARGGPVSAGTPYVVGEKGMEVFVPKTAGTIIPHGSGTSGGSATTLNLTVNVTPSFGMTPAQARAIGDGVGPAIYDYLYRRGAVGRT